MTSGLSRGRNVNQKKVLIVEDSVDVREHYRMILEEAEFLIIETETYGAAIEALQHAHIDLALLGVKLVGQSGLDILKYMHQHHPECPAIMISGFADKQSVIEAGLATASYSTHK